MDKFSCLCDERIIANQSNELFGKIIAIIGNKLRSILYWQKRKNLKLLLNMIIKEIVIG